MRGFLSYQSSRFRLFCSDNSNSDSGIPDLLRQSTLKTINTEEINNQNTQKQCINKNTQISNTQSNPQDAQKVEQDKMEFNNLYKYRARTKKPNLF